jgi:type IV fimbrial biogenesis protein FimT
MLAVKRQPGWTLVELLVTLVCAALLLAVAVPSLAALLRNVRLGAATSELFGAIHTMRAQAIARNARVVMTPLGPAQADFAAGWMVFVDRDGDLQPDQEDLVLARHDALGSDIRMALELSSQHGKAYLAYNGSGRSCSAANSMAARWGTLSLFAGKQVRRIKINMLGRPRVCNPERDRYCEGETDSDSD